jgi:hypothetical protein
LISTLICAKVLVTRRAPIATSVIPAPPIVPMRTMRLMLPLRRWATILSIRSTLPILVWLSLLAFWTIRTIRTIPNFRFKPRLYSVRTLFPAIAATFACVSALFSTSLLFASFIHRIPLRMLILSAVFRALVRMIPARFYFARIHVRHLAHLRSFVLRRSLERQFIRSLLGPWFCWALFR